MSNDRRNADDFDDFWSLDDMLPKKSITPTHISFDTKTAEISLPDSASPVNESIPKRILTNENDSNGGRTADYSSYYQVVEREYVPINPFIAKVTISQRKRALHLNENFITLAYKYFDSHGRPSGAVPFKSYIPQYTQMNAEQLNHYFYFRDQAKKGNFISTYSTYICLYAYEVINLSDKYPPDAQLDILSDLLCAYPNTGENLFKDLCNWLCDICLLNDIAPPLDKLSHIMPKILENVCLKEVFIPTNNPICDNTALYLFNSATYDYRKGRFYTTETAEFFDKHIGGAFTYAISEISKNDNRFTENGLNFATLMFESFRGALCTNSIKKIITVECVCITRSQHIRDTVTNLIKYSENQVRTLLGIKARLTVNYLSITDKGFVKTYFAPMKKTENKIRVGKNDTKTQVETAPSYDRLYEPKVKDFSLSEAQAIEKKSWKITNMLVKAFEENNQKTTKDDEKFIPVYRENSEESKQTDKIPSHEYEGNQNHIRAQQKNENFSQKTVQWYENTDEKPDCFLKKALTFAYANDFVSLKKVAEQQNLMLHTLIEKINEYTLEKIGDIVIELTDNGYVFIDFYKDEVEKMLS